MPCGAEGDLRREEKPGAIVDLPAGGETTETGRKKAATCLKTETPFSERRKKWNAFSGAYEELIRERTTWS